MELVCADPPESLHNAGGLCREADGPCRSCGMVGAVDGGGPGGRFAPWVARGRVAVGIESARGSCRGARHPAQLDFKSARGRGHDRIVRRHHTQGSIPSPSCALSQHVSHRSSGGPMRCDFVFWGGVATLVETHLATPRTGSRAERRCSRNSERGATADDRHRQSTPIFPLSSCPLLHSTFL